MTGPMWCSECGRVMVKSFMMPAWCCPESCRPIITRESLDVLDDLFKPDPMPLRDWVFRELDRALERELIQRMIIGDVSQGIYQWAAPSWQAPIYVTRVD